MEESLTKFMAESAKRHEENSNIIKEIQASTDAAIRNQGASIKTLEIQIGQMSKVLQERGFGSLPSSTKINPRDHVKSISTAKADSIEIRCIGSGPYVVSDSQFSNIFSKTIPFPWRLHDYYCDEWKEAHKLKIQETYSIGTTLHDNTLPQKEKDPRRFTIPCFIYNVCFDKALVDLEASVSVMTFSTYTNLGLEDLAHTRLTVELADKTIKHPRGIAENMLVKT
ncbi:retrotransposon protein, partial [Tanacetum coccineum]